MITCPIRFRQDWIIAENAAAFFFGENANWTSLTEVRLKDANGQSAENIDMVLVSYDDRGKVLDFGAVEVQAVYISGNVRKPFEMYMSDPNGWESYAGGKTWLIPKIRQWLHYQGGAGKELIEPFAGGGIVS